MLNVTIDGIKVQAKEGSTILEAARSVGIEIPTLCYLKDLTPEASCRICLVEIEGNPKLLTACSTPVAEGNVIFTKSEKVIAARRSVLDLMLSTHKADCFSCGKNGDCQLQNLCYAYGVEKTSFEGVRNEYPIDDSNEFFTYNPQQCILCQRCVNVCQKLHGEAAIGITGRGFKAKIATPFDQLIRGTNCVSCGNCVSVCPVGALLPKTKVRAFETKKVPTTCTYCGVGCQLELQVKDDTVVGAQPLYGEANKGLLCVKGKFGYNFINHKDRLTKPLIRKDGALVEASWEEAVSYIADKIKSIKAESGPDALAGLSSARCSNEDNYVFQKMVRAVFGTNNVDHCARLCHASTVAGLAITLGSGAMTNSIAEAADQDVVFVTGSNTTETHPVIGSLIRQAKRKGAKIIVAEPRRIPLCREADVFLQIKPGTNVALFNGMMHVIISEGLQDQKYIDERTEGYEALKEMVKDYTPEVVAEICNIDAEDLKKAARMYATAEKAGIYYAMGVTQHSTGTEGVMGTSNLALLCGKIGKYGCGVNPLRGQNNVQGACDMGCLPTDFPAYQKVFHDAVREKFEQAWDVPLSGKPGLTVTEIMNAVEAGRIRGLYIMGENPMMSDPDLNHVKKALESCELLVVQDIFLTETAALADVVLPGCTFAEKDGTFTNTERRVQRIRKAISPVGESKADFEILSDVMAALGYENSFHTAAEVFAEMAALAPSYGGMSYERLEKGGLQWPCPTADHPGTPILHVGKFSRGERALFKPAPYRPSAETPDAEYPMIFTTGRILYHYHTSTMTGRVQGLMNISGRSYVEVNPADAAKLDILSGDSVKVSSRRGGLVVEARITDIVPEGVLFMPFHFADGPANVLTNTALDPTAKIPELKVCAARIEKA
ncbi:MAG: formate dehydrogenase subunit alpha [Oscillospiraceae bacterium]|nr:formate dehydrogenase subunit alpha [Oscillospiraceae bacterium]MBR2422321.1 formate dehydrogenase subunit alpha [Oscillospiraceae bacterium]